MSNKKENMVNGKWLVLIIILIGVIVLIPLILSYNKKSNYDNVPSSEIIIEDAIPSLDDVKSKMTDLYGGEGKVVEVREDNNNYIITIINSNNNRVLNIYEMDKQTGVIEEISFGESSSASNE